MGKSFASAEDQAVYSLYTRLGKMKLITDKDGKPLKWETVYPSIKQLIASCKKDEIKLPKNPKFENILLAMLKAGYSNVKHPPSTEDEIKSWDENVFNKEIAKLGLYPIPKSAKTSQKVSKTSQEDPGSPEPLLEDDDGIEWDQDVQDEEQAQREADKQATLDK